MKNKIINALCVWSVILFLIIWYDSNLEIAFRFTLFIVAISVFIFNMIYAYQVLKEDGFKLYNTHWWKYFFISTALIITLSIVFLSGFQLKLGIILSSILLIILFIYDLFKVYINKKH